MIKNFSKYLYQVHMIAELKNRLLMKMLHLKHISGSSYYWLEILIETKKMVILTIFTKDLYENSAFNEWKHLTKKILSLRQYLDLNHKNPQGGGSNWPPSLPPAFRSLFTVKYHSQLSSHLIDAKNIFWK